jgi:hypothetical protein
MKDLEVALENLSERLDYVEKESTELVIYAMALENVLGFAHDLCIYNGIDLQAKIKEHFDIGEDD